jgi:hypothetical protein
VSALKFLRYLSGKPAEAAALQSSSGVGDADKIVATGADGKLDITLMPSSLTVQTKIVAASEDLAAGELVHIWNDTGTPKAKLADASLGLMAHGYVKSGALTGADATVYLEGVNNQLSGLTAGDVWLGNAGAVTQTPPTSGSGGIAQLVGTALSATELDFEKEQPIGLA